MNNKRRKAIEWIRDNYEMVQLFEQYAQQLVDKHRHFSINLIRERIRWDCVLEHGEDCRFPNAVTPYIARYLLGRHHNWRGFLQCKRTADEPNDINLIYEGEVFPQGRA